MFHLVPSPSGPTVGGGQPVAVEQFERHGFVHCCFREQITEIATWWFDAGVETVALEIDPACLTAELRFEASPTRWYPHIYGPIDGDAVVDQHLLRRSGAGVTSLPPALAWPTPAYHLVARRHGGMAEITWCDGALGGDAAWADAARDAVASGQLVELLGGVAVAATLATPYESFSLLVHLADELVRYDGDGFFDPQEETPR